MDREGTRQAMAGATTAEVLAAGMMCLLAEIKQLHATMYRSAFRGDKRHALSDDEVALSERVAAEDFFEALWSVKQDQE